MTGDGRTAQIHLRLTPEESSRIRVRAASRGLTVSAHVRRAALADGPSPAPVADARELRELYAELRRVGNNLNQIARALNTYGLKGSTPRAVQASLAELDRATGAVSGELARARGGL